MLTDFSLHGTHFIPEFRELILGPGISLFAVRPLPPGLPGHKANPAQKNSRLGSFLQELGHCMLPSY